ncbi:hypothetical protein T03_6382 [Trichinella britovi]|uniref:Uncharacterized protein n=2 Tax=Trichinella TaxID=6333 RepID=A0A0V1D3R7_TRIBR|nr:hypothetical protein T05_14246 [Trichinella murrelli]KRX84989.1 hypothetical protein T06_11710 [Trichinella sp. T6]KRY55635.1 hypothetical protein T03_6382 [Trichinella britovi]
MRDLLYIISLVPIILLNFAEAFGQLQCFCKQTDCALPKCRNTWSLLNFKHTEEATSSSCHEDVYKTVNKCFQNVTTWEDACKCGGFDCQSFLHFMRRFISKFELLCEREIFHHHTNEHGEIGGSHADELDDLDFDTIQKPNKHLFLLVIIPLCVGAFAVIMIFLNYHCKMC